MTIELKPEQERILHDAMRQGRFHSVDEALDEALRSLAPGREAASRPARRRSPMEAAAHMREVRKENKLPSGMTIRDMIHEGRA